MRDLRNILVAIIVIVVVVNVLTGHGAAVALFATALLSTIATNMRPVLIAAALVTTFVVTTRLGRLFGVDPKLSELIAAGTSICGASAVIATNTVTRAPDEDAAYAVACVTIFGSIAKARASSSPWSITA